MQMNNENDFKYLLEDFSTVYIGANYSYKEIVEHETAPLKFKEATVRVFVKECDEKTTIAEHLSVMKEQEKSYLLYHQLKAKIKVTQLKKSGKGYQSMHYTFDEFMDQYQSKTANGECFVEEIVIKKLHLFGSAV